MDPDERERTKLRVQIGISAIILVASFALIFLGKYYPTDCTKWAFGMVGIVVGYWLK